MHFIGLPYAGNEGCYGYFTKTNHVRWERCRELFHNHLGITGKPSFLYYCKTNVKNLCDMIHQVEEHLNIKLSHIEETDTKNIAYILPSKFWRRQRTRISLFTILVRASQNFNCHKQHWEKGIFKDSYLDDTREATKHFLAGNTFCLTNQLWVQAFRHNEINKLVKPSWWLLVKPFWWPSWCSSK